MQPRILIPVDRPWRVLGLMSGTSADGVDVVAIEVDPGAFQDGKPFRSLLGHRSAGYPAQLRDQVLAAASNRLLPGELCILQRRLGDHHAGAAKTLCEALALVPDLASLHGQTIQHHPSQGASLQLADPYVLVEALGCPVVWDLRRRDLALGGQGAPLVPLPERWLHGAGPWLALNLGGIANLAVWDGEMPRAWDTGPGMSLLDLAAKLWLGQAFDPEGASASGTVAEPILERWLGHPYFKALPPKSTGREVFGEAWLAEEAGLLEALPLADRLATLAAFTAASVTLEAARSAPWPAGMRGLVSGGGARHRRVRAELATRLPLQLEEDTTFPSGAREAASWALLGAASALGDPRQPSRGHRSFAGRRIGELGVAVRWGRWSDHLPLWMALGATMSAGIYEPSELVIMALPLAAAALVEAMRWDLSRYHRWLEIGALVFFLGDLTRGRGLFTVAIHTLFVLAGARLVLPRDLSQRRQLLLIGFLLYLTTAIGTTDLTFLVWTLAWSCAATLALLQQCWEPSAALRRGALSRPPYAQVPGWVGAALVFGVGFFMLMPRLSLGLRPGIFPGARAFGQAGLGDRLDLAGRGPIEPNPEVAVRIAPPAGIDPATNPQWSRGLELLRGITLEAVHGLRWEPADLTPPIDFVSGRNTDARVAEFLYTLSSQGILALPAGLVRMEPSDPVIVPGAGASRRWRFLRTRPVPLTITWNPRQPEPSEVRLSPRRLDLLTRLEPEHEAARRASFRLAPSILPTPQLALVLETALRGFGYTLDNPSGQSPNPLEDFLERTKAGHCEYFASSMALMLRARGVPARVVNGYRLGPWIPEGGYFRVSQNEAHSWVEYWHEGRWWTADPTPQGFVSRTSDNHGLRAYERWLDAVRYRWDRYVVRFSDQDQQTGFSWIQEQVQGWEWRWKAPPKAAKWTLGLVILAWVLWRSRNHWRPTPEGPGRIRALRPLVARTRRTAPVKPGDTARTWLLRLAALRPERGEALQRLADSVDTEAYGPGNTTASALAKAEAAAWRGWQAISR